MFEDGRYVFTPVGNVFVGQAGTVYVLTAFCCWAESPTYETDSTALPLYGLS